MSNAVETTIQLYNQWGHVYAPETFKSKRQAREHVNWMIKHGYACSYRVIEQTQDNNQQK